MTRLSLDAGLGPAISPRTLVGRSTLLQALRRIGGRDLTPCECFEDGVDRRGVALVGWTRHRIDHLVETGDHGRVRQPKAFFHVLDLPATLEEHLDEGELLTRQPPEPSAIEVAL